MLTESNSNDKKMYLCVKGPMDKHHLALTSPFTAWFTLHGQYGRYAYGQWQERAVYDKLIAGTL